MCFWIQERYNICDEEVVMLHSSERFNNCFDFSHWNSRSPTDAEIRQNSSLDYYYLSVMSAMRSHLCCVKTSKRSHSFSIPVPFVVESINQPIKIIPKSWKKIGAVNRKSLRARRKNTSDNNCMCSAHEKKKIAQRRTTLLLQ